MKRLPKSISITRVITYQLDRALLLKRLRLPEDTQLSVLVPGPEGDVPVNIAGEVTLNAVVRE